MNFHGTDWLAGVIVALAIVGLVGFVIHELRRR